MRKVRNDPFAGDPENSPAADAIASANLGIGTGQRLIRTTEVLKEGERGTFVEQALANQQPTYVDNSGVEHGQEVQPMSTYTRIADLTPSLDLVSLEDLSNVELFVWRFDEHKGTPDMGPFLTLECSTMNNVEHRFLTNCGGVDVMRKIKNAFEAVDAGKALPPLAARFHKIRTQSGNAFWVIS